MIFTDAQILKFSNKAMPVLNRQAHNERNRYFVVSLETVEGAS